MSFSPGQRFLDKFLNLLKPVKVPSELREAIFLAVEGNNSQELEKVLTGLDPRLAKKAINFPRTENGRTYLQEAVSQQSVAICDILLKSGANPNAKDYENKTPMTVAADKGAFLIYLPKTTLGEAAEVIVTIGKLLLQYGGNPDYPSTQTSPRENCGNKSA